MKNQPCESYFRLRDIFTWRIMYPDGNTYDSTLTIQNKIIRYFRTLIIVHRMVVYNDSDDIWALCRFTTLAGRQDCLINSLPMLTPMKTSKFYIVDPLGGNPSITNGFISQMEGNARIVLLTHWGRDKMVVIFQTTFSNAFSWMKMNEFRLRFHLNLFPRVKLIIFHHKFRQWLGGDQATSHYLKQWWLVYWRIYASLGLNELFGTIVNQIWIKIRWYLFKKICLKCRLKNIAIVSRPRCDYVQAVTWFALLSQIFVEIK